MLEFDGDFLVRKSANSPGQYVLSGKQTGAPRHLLLVDPEGNVSVHLLCLHIGCRFSGHYRSFKICFIYIYKMSHDDHF